MKRDRRTNKISRIPIHEGSGNVFKDLGFANSEAELAKAEITVRIIKEIAARGLIQARAAVQLGVSQADVSDLVRGKLKGYSFERLFRFLNALGLDVSVVVHKRCAEASRGSVEVVDELTQYPVRSHPRGRAGLVAEPKPPRGKKPQPP